MTARLVGLWSILMVLASAALAGPVEFCFLVETDFDAGQFEGGDYWNTNGDRQLRGIFVDLIDNDTQTSLVESGYADDDGCISATLDDTHTYTVIADSRIEVDGQQARAHFCIHEDDPYDPSALPEPTGYSYADCTSDIDNWERRTYVVETDYAPPATQQLTTVYENVVPDAQSIWLAVVGRVLNVAAWNYSASCPLEFFEKPFGLGGCGIIRHSTTTDLPPGAQVCSTYNAMNRPWTTAHETGHAIAFRREAGEHASCPCGCDAAGLNGEIDTTAGLNNCQGLGPGTFVKGLLSKEYQATAAREGWADFVAAVTFNDPTESSCRFHSETTMDVDLDRNPGTAVPPFLSYYYDNGYDTADADNNPQSDSLSIVSCKSVPLGPTMCTNWTTFYGVTACSDTSMASYLDGRDWLENVVNGADAFGCTDGNSMINRGTEYDWLRFWWDMRNTSDGQGIDTTKLIGLIDAMDPRSWDPDDNLTGSDGSTSTNDDVTVRLIDAANNAVCFTTAGDCLAPVNAEKDNGQDH